MAQDTVTTELVTVFIDGESASTVLTFPDGSSMSIEDASIVLRSSLLSSFLKIDDTATFSAPHGYLQSWLQCVEYTAHGSSLPSKVSDGDTLVRLSQVCLAHAIHMRHNAAIPSQVLRNCPSSQQERDYITFFAVCVCLCSFGGAHYLILGSGCYVAQSESQLDMWARVPKLWSKKKCVFLLHRRIVRHEPYTVFVQAADFFGDDTALDTICQHISDCVFPRAGEEDKDGRTSSPTASHLAHKVCFRLCPHAETHNAHL